MEINLTESQARRLIYYLIEVCYKIRDKKNGTDKSNAYTYILQDLQNCTNVYNYNYLISTPNVKEIIQYVYNHIFPYLSYLQKSINNLGYLTVLTDQIYLLVEWYNSKFENKIVLEKEFELLTKECKTQALNLVEYL